MCPRSAGGGYDQYARLLAKHIVRHIPGEPTMIVQNMVGAEGIRAANHLYAAAEQDGTALGALSRNIGTVQLFQPGIQFDALPLPVARLAAAGGRAVHHLDPQGAALARRREEAAR